MTSEALAETVLVQLLEAAGHHEARAVSMAEMQRARSPAATELLHQRSGKRVCPGALGRLEA